MNGTERCPKCGRELIAEETPSHQCGLQVGAVARVADLTYEWWTSAELPQYGDEVLIVKATDGTLYRIRPSPEMKRGQKSPEDEPEPLQELVPQYLCQRSIEIASSNGKKNRRKSPLTDVLTEVDCCAPTEEL